MVTNIPVNQNEKATNVGRIMIVYKGLWSDKIKYKKYDWVIYDGSSYICNNKDGSINVLPTLNTDWKISALGVSKSILDEIKPVALTGSYNDLIDTPFIPTNNNQIDNGAGYITKDVSDLTNYYTSKNIDTKIIGLNDSISIKANKTYVDTELNKKVDTTVFNNDLKLKADITYVDSEIEKILVDGSVPTKTSQLTNDGADGINSYITSNVDNLTNYTLTSSLSTVATSGNYNDLKGLPTIPSNTNQLNNNSGFITKDIDSLTYYTTTEVLTRDYATKEEVSAIPKFKIEVVTNLPTTGNPAIIYLLKSGEESQNIYTEYIWVNNKWEKLGTQKIDLTNYAKKSDIPTNNNQLTNGKGYITNSVNNLTNYTLTSELSTVATSGSYNDLIDIPTIPSNNNQLTNGAGYITKDVSNLTNYTLTNKLKAVATTGSYTDLINKPTIPTDNATLSNGAGYITKSVTDLTNYTTTTVLSRDYAKKSEIPTDNATLSNGAKYITSSALSPYALKSSLATVATTGNYANLTGTPTLSTVATSGNYSDLNGLPTIPSNNNQLTNGAGYITSSGSCNYATSSGAVGFMKAHNSNEVNFNAGATIYFGYRAIDGGAKPTTYIFGSSEADTSTSLCAGKVYNAGADYAECFDNSNLNYKDVLHRIVQINNIGKVELATYNSKTIIGIISDNYGHLMNGIESDIENGKKIPVGLAGTLYVDTKDKLSENNLGKFITSDNNGYATVIENKNDFNVVGKIIGFDFTNNRYKVLLVLR